MRILLIFSVFCFLSLVLSSCCKCDIDNHFLDLSFRIVNVNGENLFIEPNRKFIPDSVQLYTTKYDSIYFQKFSYSNAPSDTLINTGFIEKIDTILVKLNTSDFDTLVLKYKGNVGRCCNDKYYYESIEQIFYNGEISKRVRGIYEFIK